MLLEYRAIRSVMGHDSLRMNSTKSMIGHLLGGAGAVEAVATIKAIETGAGHLHFVGATVQRDRMGRRCVL
jgi:3-oxoacyl-[acyl-carrier-protein] synthase II